MLRSLNELVGFSIVNGEDDLGKVYNFLFDDDCWVIRYFVVDTGVWLSGRKVLVSPMVIEYVNRKIQVIVLSINKEMLESSPDIDTDKPVSRQMEERYLSHFNLDMYWQTPQAADLSTLAPIRNPKPRKIIKIESETDDREGSRDSHLRSLNDVTDYTILAKDGELGHLKDFIIEDDTWIIRYAVVDTGKWIFGKKVLVSIDWIEKIIWMDKKVYVDLEKEAIRNCPEFIPEKVIDREYEEILYDYYGRPYYWDS